MMYLSCAHMLFLIIYSIMKTDNTNLVQRVRGLILSPVLALALLFLYSHTLYPSDSRSILDESQVEVITVVGKVIDANNEALDSVIVKDVNSDNETISDMEGKFTISLKEPTKVSFAKFGFEEMEMEIAESDSSLVVMLTPESNEMIVQGFGSGMNGGKNHNWVANSFTSIIENNPLYVIDNTKKGVDFNIETINPDDVMSIEVLADSIAEELYGAEGERGAVLIMTNYFMPTDNNVSKELVEDEVTVPTISLKEKYEMYKDTMNARNARLRERNRKASNSKTVMPTQQELPIDSVGSLNKKDLEVKMENSSDTTSMSFERDTTLIEIINDTTTLKMQVDTISVGSKNDTQ